MLARGGSFLEVSWPVAMEIPISSPMKPPVGVAALRQRLDQAVVDPGVAEHVEGEQVDAGQERNVRPEHVAHHRERAFEHEGRIVAPVQVRVVGRKYLERWSTRSVSIEITITFGGSSAGLDGGPQPATAAARASRRCSPASKTTLSERWRRGFARPRSVGRLR